MAEIVLGIGTSHTPMLSLPAELWPVFAKGDENNPELAYPPHGVVMSYQEALTSASPELRGKYQGPAPFRAQADDCRHSSPLGVTPRMPECRRSVSTQRTG